MSWNSNTNEGDSESYRGNDWQYRDNNNYESVDNNNNFPQSESTESFKQRSVMSLDEAITYCKYWQRGRCLHESTCSLPHPSPDSVPLPEMIVLVGLPCSGKTHYFTENFDNRGYRWINQSMTGSLQRVMNDIEDALRRKVPVVIDRVNISASQRAQFIDIAKKWNVPVRCIVFNTPIEDCKILNEYRFYTAQLAFYQHGSKRRPPFVNEDSFEKYVTENEAPTYDEGFYNIEYIEPPAHELVLKFQEEIPSLKEQVTSLEAQQPTGHTYHDRTAHDRERRPLPRRDHQRDYHQKSASYGGDRPRRDYGSDRYPRRDYGDNMHESGDHPPRRDYGDRPPRRDYGNDRPPRRDYGGDRRNYGDNRREYGNPMPHHGYDNAQQAPRQEYSQWNNSNDYSAPADSNSTWAQSTW